MSNRPNQPIVAIVGRPNVGKSTFFNRIAGYPRALVKNTPGITRDRIVESVEVAGQKILLVDTAGLDDPGDAELAEAVQRQARTAIEQADAVLFLVDGKAGLLPADEAIARELRRTDQPLALAVNKIDNLKHQERVHEFYALGFDLCAGVSAAHGSGVWDLLEALIERLQPQEAHAFQTTTDAERSVAILGRPNVGKSSLLNCLAGRPRAVVSSEPGTTRDAIDLLLTQEEKQYRFVDTAGIRRHARQRDDTERLSALLAVRALERAQVALVLLDAEEGMTDQDARVANLARECGRATALLLNKWDRIQGDEARCKQVLEEVRRGIRFMSDAPLLAISAKTAWHTKRIFPLVDSLWKATNLKISTAELNRWLSDTVSRHEPAMAYRGTRKRPVKLFYATQIDVAPPTFTIFCSDPVGMKRSYSRYLVNQLRENFQLEGAPVRIQLRHRRESAEES